ncbi:unnamed protein product [Orchesella dallaii]|uniref:Uncharacterized protein n=1 Tax=Orchesella dallaii TaxID=48710 RepID=A0ABP1S0W0_9HEXA
MMINFYVVKSLEVFSDCRHEVRVRWKDISHKFTNISSVEDVQKPLHRLSSLKLCSGAKNCNMFNVWPSAHKILNIWYADDCEQTTPDTRVVQAVPTTKNGLS